MTEESTESFGVELAEEGETFDAENFDFDAYLDRKLKFPMYKATIYTDASSAAKIVEVLEYKAEAEKKLSSLKSKQEQQERHGGRSLAGVGGSSLGNEILAAEERVNELARWHSDLDAEFRASRLEIALQLPKPWNELDKELEQQTKKKYPDLPELKPGAPNQKALEHEGWAYKQRLVIVACLKYVRNSEGASPAKVTEEHIKALYDRLPQNETTKLNNAINMTVSGGNATQRAVDAGFPG